MKKALAIILAVALTGVMAVAAFASEVSKYYGIVKSVDASKSAVVFSALKLEGDTHKVFPKNISITLNKTDFERIKLGHEKVSSHNPPQPLEVNVGYETEDGKNTAKSIIIIHRGC